MLPNNWALTTIANVISLTSGNDLTADLYSDNHLGIPYITGASNIENGKILVNRYTHKKYTNSYLNEILLTCKGTIGKIATNTIGDIHVARQIMSIKSYIDNKYLISYLLTIIEELNKNAKSMIPGIDRKTLLNNIMLLPPLIEQTRIVNKLNHIFNLINVI